jgi:hypothetical protein
MLTREAPSFVWALSTCERVFALVEFGTAPKDTESAVPDGAQEKGLFHLNTLEQALEGMGLKATVAAVRRTKSALGAGGMTYKQLGRANQDIYRRFQDEMEGRYFFLLDDREAALFDAKEPPFGDTVETAFSAAGEDIVEGAKCLGLARYTASVFHLMRAMECAVQALSEELKIEDCEREWGKLLSDMETKIKRMPKGEKKDSWSESHSHLYHVKQAWRNKTMHPKKTYTQEEAEAVFAAVRVFMRHLATLLPDPIEKMIG